MSTVDLALLAEEIEQLMAEGKSLSTRMSQIRQTVAEKMKRLDSELQSFLPGRIRPSRPRPVEDRLLISVGRTINVGVKGGWEMGRIRTAAISKATELSQKYGANELPPEFVARIDRRIRKRLTLNR